MKENSIRGIVFDLDGTLIDSYRAIYLGFHHAYTRMGLSPLSFEEVRRVVGQGLNHTFRELLGPERVPRAVDLFREKYEEIFRDHTHLLPEVREVLESLHARGIRLAVATNKLGRFAREIFRQFGMEDLFSAVVGDGDVAQNKPHPEMLRLAMAKMGTKEDETLFVGDSVIDIQTARNAGVRVLAVPTGNTAREDLAKARPTALLERFSDLLAHV